MGISFYRRGRSEGLKTNPYTAYALADTHPDYAGKIDLDVILHPINRNLDAADRRLQRGFQNG